MSTDGPDHRDEHRVGLSDDMTDLLTESIVVIHEPDSADLWGAFEETALSASDAWDAWDANSDLSLS